MRFGASGTFVWCWLIAASIVHAQVTDTRPTVGLQQNVPTAFALENATVVVEPGKTLESVTVVIEDGLIREVSSNPSLADAVRRIDCSGKTIYAGLIDAYSDEKYDWQQQGSSHWNDTVRPELLVADRYEPDDDDNQGYRKHGFVARLVAPSDGQIKGISALVSTGEGERNSQILNSEVALHARLTANWGRDDFPGSPMGAVALFRQVFYDTQWYREAWKTYRTNPGLERPETNSALAKLLEVTDKSMSVIIDSSNERFFLRADRFGREFGLPIIVRGSGREYRRLNEVLATGRSIILPVEFPKAPDVSTVEAANRARLQELMHWDHAPENPAALVHGGANVALTTDGLKKLEEFMPAVRKAIQRGLTADEALATLTVNPAKMFKVDAMLGTVEKGKLASLIVTDGALFEKGTKVVETWVDGQRFLHQRAEKAPSGEWSLNLGEDEKPLTVIVKEKERRLSGSARRGDKKAKLQSAKFDGTQLSFYIPGKVMKDDGVTMVSIVVDSEDLDGAEFVGRAVKPDGSLQSLTATWSEIQESEPEEEEEAEKESGEATDSESDAEEASAEGESEDDKDDDGDDEPSPGADAEGESAEAETDDAEGDNAETDDTETDDSEDKEEITDPLYPVNYPLGAYGFEEPPARPDLVAFSGATVWTCGEQGTIEGATVIVRDGKIEAVGKDLTIPVGASVQDVTGKHITPGVIDCHSHIATDGGVNDSTQAVTAEVRIGDFMDPDDIAIYRQIAGGTTTANVLHGSANPIGGQNQVIKMRWGVAPQALKFEGAPEGIKFALGENVKQSNWGDDHTTRYPQTRMGVDEIQADAFERAVAYRKRQEEWQRDRRGLPPRKDLELEALAEIVEGKRWIHCHSYRQSEILALMKTCDRFGITIGTFQHILEGYKVADEMAKRGVMGSAFADWWAYKFEVYDAIPHAGALMHNAGVVVSFNSDDAELGRHLNIDAAKAMKYGNLSAEDALKFVTLNPAKQLRIDDRVGSLEPGKDADIVVWSHPPLSIYASCEETWIDGRRYFSKAEESELRKRDAARHAALIQRVLETNAPQRKGSEQNPNEEELWPRSDTFCHGHEGHGHEGLGHETHSHEGHSHE